jgi:dihydrofolate synthase/folylpolyglutamate synthase
MTARTGSRSPLDESLAYLYGLRRFGMRLDLEVPRRLLDRLGSPQRAYPIVHIAGSNGKGSTAAITESILRAAGLRTGLYTSPHLVDFAERIRVNGRPIGPRALARVVAGVRPHGEEAARRAGRPATFFEITTAMALVHFAEAGVDAAIVETGLGGRFDATNVLVPAVCAITPIALEHRKQLGRTLGAIAREKAGILKCGVPAVSAAQEHAARDVLARRARTVGAPLAFLGRDFHAGPVSEGIFDYKGFAFRLPGLRCGLAGSHQIGNAALALAACERLAESGVAIGPEAMRRGVAAARWPGRLEIILRDGTGRPRVVVDGAHNPAAARAITDALPRAFSYRRLLLVSAAMADKDLGALTRALSREVLRTGGLVIATAPAFERAADPRRLADRFRRAGARAIALRTVPAAIDAALARARAGDLVLVAGSLYLVGEARAHLLPAGRRRPVMPGPV